MSDNDSKSEGLADDDPDLGVTSIRGHSGPIEEMTLHLHSGPHESGTDFEIEWVTADSVPWCYLNIFDELEVSVQVGTARDLRALITALESELEKAQEKGYDDDRTLEDIPYP